jgi:hypothetical protein
MKKVIVQATSVAFSLLLLNSCGSSSGKKDIDSDLKKTVENKLQKQDDAKKEDETAKAGPAEAMGVKEAVKYLGASDANKGTIITVKGYPRGTTKAVNGEFMLYVSDNTGTGLPEENFACLFKEEMKEQVRTHKADNLVNVTGKIAWNNGMIVLKDAKLAE